MVEYPVLPVFYVDSEYHIGEEVVMVTVAVVRVRTVILEGLTDELP